MSEAEAKEVMDLTDAMGTPTTVIGNIAVVIDPEMEESIPEWAQRLDNDRVTDAAVEFSRTGVRKVKMVTLKPKKYGEALWKPPQVQEVEHTNDKRT